MFSNDNNVETIAQLVEVLKHYIGLQSEYVKLDVIEKVVRLITALTVVAVFCLLLVFADIFLLRNGQHSCSGTQLVEYGLHPRRRILHFAAHHFHHFPAQISRASACKVSRRSANVKIDYVGK